MTKSLFGSQTALSFTGADLSPIASISTESLFPSVKTGGTAAMSFIGAVQNVVVPVATAAGGSPIVSQFLNAANTEYSTSGTPAGMTAFLVNGKQLSMTDNTTGLSAKVWLTSQGQVIIAYQGTTGGNNLFSDPTIAISQIGADIGVYGKTTPAAETEALSFAKTVEGDAGADGISAANVFVTGHSLGGIEAEYVAQQTGLGGIGFEPTGLPTSAAAGATGQNFVDVVTYGDPVGNYSSDIAGEQPFAPSSGLAHYGQIVMIGDPSAQTTLSSDVKNWNPNNFITGTGIVLNLAGLLIDYHLPDTQAFNLGVTLSPTNIADDIGDKTGPVLNVGSLDIAQLIAGYANNSPVIHAVS